MLKVLFGSAARVAVLRRLLLHPHDEIHLRQLAAQSGLAPRSAQLEVDRLTQIELLIERRSGNRRYIRANKGHPLFPPLVDLLDRTVGVRARIRSAMEDDRSIGRVLLYGPHAVGEFAEDNQVQILVVGDATARAVSDLLAPVAEALQVDIRPVVMTEKDFQARRASNDHFVTSVLATRAVPLIWRAAQ